MQPSADGFVFSDDEDERPVKPVVPAVGVGSEGGSLVMNGEFGCSPR